MPVYELKVAGSDKPRLVKAATPAAARNHVVQATSVTAERMADLMDDGVKLEKASAAAEAESQGEGEGANKSEGEGEPGDKLGVGAVLEEQAAKTKAKTTAEAVK